jgi:hypothetical protein
MTADESLFLQSNQDEAGDPSPNFCLVVMKVDEVSIEMDFLMLCNKGKWPACPQHASGSKHVEQTALNGDMARINSDAANCKSCLAKTFLYSSWQYLDE